MNDFPQSRAAPGACEARATRAGFFIAGLGLSAWAPLVPYAKERLGVQDGALGMLLLCLGVGSIIAMPAAGAVASRLGCKRVITAAVFLLCAMLPLLAVAPSPPWLGIVLFLFGAGVGALDCVINIQAVIVERAHARPMMSGFHGLFSLGGLVGAGGVSGLLSVGASALHALVFVMVAILLLHGLIASHHLPYGGSQGGAGFAPPRGVVMVIGVFCFVLFLTEGAVLDWSAVLLAGSHGIPAAHAGAGYACFAVSMTLCRLAGDGWVKKAGPRSTITAGALLAALGLALATLVSSWWLALMGFMLVGMGCSNIVPVLFSLCGRQQDMPESLAVSAVSTLGYAGILLGPALIGLVSHAADLPAALLLLCAMLLGIAVSVQALTWLGRGRLIH